jgi:hypothetical protein
MSARRVTTYLTDAVQVVIGPLGDGVSLSGRLTAVVLRYGDIMRRSCPPLSLAEWSAIMDACNGLCMGGDTSAPAFIWAEIADAAGVGEKWGVDQEGLSQRLRRLPYSGQVAVAEVVERFWRANEEGGRETRLIHAGAVVAETDNAPDLNRR